MNPHFNRTVTLASLALALTFMVVVIFGAKFYFEHYAKQPVAVTALPSPEAESAACSTLIESVPQRVYGHGRSEIAEPVPAGVAAWATVASEATVLRCGVDMPFQYTELSQLVPVAGVHWLQVRDMTPGSQLTTWYTADRTPVVAVTTWEQGEPTALSEAIGSNSLFAAQPPEPRPAPLQELPADEPQRVTGLCEDFMAQLPAQLADDYQRAELSGDFGPYYAVWQAPGREELVVRCGVGQPEAYEPGASLQQINSVPWLEDTTLAFGTTASTWYALGFDTFVAVHTPQDSANQALSRLSTMMSELWN